MKASTVGITLLGTVVSFGIHAHSANAQQTENIWNASWTIVRDGNRYRDVYVDINGILLRNDIVTFDVITDGGHDHGRYNRFEHNCRTNQMRLVRDGSVVSKTQVQFVSRNVSLGSPNNISKFVCNLAQQRWGALQATKHFRSGTVGFGVHRAIKVLYHGNETLGGYGAFGNRYSAKIGTFFQRSDIQELLKKPINSDANLHVAQEEVKYWESVYNDQTATSDNKKGARLALKFTPENRAKLQKHYANGEYAQANALILMIYPGAILP